MQESIAQIESLISQGRYFEARTKAESSVKTDNHIRLKQLYALTLSKCGLPEPALEFLEPVYREFPDDVESAGIVASINKELFRKNQNSQFAIRSRDTYLKNFTVTKNYYTGINAASMSAMAGQASRGREIANEIIAILEPSAKDFWVLATLGEAYLLTKNRAKATEYYVQARKVAGNDWGRVTSVYNQLWLLNHYLPVSSEIIKLFNPPTVVAFVGHMIDKPERPTPRFPSRIEASIKQSIVHSIHSMSAHIGYCSLACGGDILFAEAMVETGGELNLFLPFEKNDFIQTSLAFAGEQWVNRFEALINQYPVNYITHDHYSDHDDLFQFQSKIILGSAVLRSLQQHTEPTLITVLSEFDLKRQEGGTRDTLRLWPYPQHHLNINPDMFVGDSSHHSNQVPSQSVKNSLTITRPVSYLIFCDLSDIESMEKGRVLKTIDSKINSLDDSLKYSEVGEEGALLIYNTLASAEDLANSILESAKSLNATYDCKISLHAGPVYLDEESGSSYKKASGEAIDFIKLMSSSALPGAVSASSQFAALLALDYKNYSLEYSGILKSESLSFSVYKVEFKNNR